ncbi:uncharacterized protein [Embiotoca jacksoni]|uniref:uncharacterized protein n=1 Tax=Embiotoca jacksoni TaxID=100190 RepID=UPI003703AAE2
MMNMTVAGEEVPFLVDTGATCSTMNQPLGPISNQTMSVVGFSGVSQTLSFTTPLPTQLAGQQHLHRFLISPEVPVNLLGRDLLIKLGATILCGPEGLVVSFPNGTDIPCGLTCERSGQYLVRSLDTLHADIYWGLLQPSHEPTTGLLSAYNSWRPWISHVHPYVPPPDPPHLTLFYDRDGDECYLEAFQEQIQGKIWQLHTGDILVGQEGVAAIGELSTEQELWFKMSDTSFPHVSLALHPQHEARELGPMVKRGHDCQDWESTCIPRVLRSRSLNMFRIHNSTSDVITLEHLWIPGITGVTNLITLTQFPS